MKIHFHLALPVTIPLVATLALPLGSCNATSGAAAGAMIGAGLGQLAGGDTESTLLGAALGAAIGGLYGYNVEQKREARILASREATRAELEAANRAAATISASSREQAIARAKAYEAEHADEYMNPAPKRVIPVSSVPTEPVGAEASPSQVPSGSSNSAEFTQEVGSGSDTVDLPDRTDQLSQTTSNDSVGEVPETRLEPAAEEVVVQAEPVEELVEEPAPVAEEPVPVMEGELAPVLVEVVSLPGGGVVLKDLETGTFIDNEVHQIDEIRDVSDNVDGTLQESVSEEPIPFTLILSDKETGQAREYTAIYSA